jgi:hypothetical protein
MGRVLRRLRVLNLPPLAAPSASSFAAFSWPVTGRRGEGPAFFFHQRLGFTAD